MFWLQAICYHFPFNQSGMVRNLHIRVPAQILKIALVNYQTVHTNSFWTPKFTEKLMQNLGIQTEACTFLLRKMSMKLKVDFYFLDKSIHCNTSVYFKGTVLSSDFVLVPAFAMTKHILFCLHCKSINFIFPSMIILCNKWLGPSIYLVQAMAIQIPPFKCSRISLLKIVLVCYVISK